MIAKGNLHGDGAKLAAYLVTGKEDERAELVELRGLGADNIRDGFANVSLWAEATRCEKPFFHCYVRLPEGEALERFQWRQVADRIEHQLGFDGQGRAVAFHHGPEGTHLHIAWSRIDLEHERAIDPGLFKLKLKEISRELEKEFGLTRIRNERDPGQKTLAPGRNEFEQSRRLGTDLKAIRETIRACWERADTGRGFEAALAEHGYVLARGDKRDFVVIDPAGGDHALGKRITGVTAAETRAKLADINKQHLPSVDQAKAVQAERAPPLTIDRTANTNIPQPALAFEAIQRDPWNAVDLTVPKNADRSLLAAVAFAASYCERAASAAARVAEIVDPADVNFYRERAAAAGERRDEARYALGHLPPEQIATVSPLLNAAAMQDKAAWNIRGDPRDHPRRSGQEPAITAAEIDANPWAVVHAQLDGATLPLLERVASVAERLQMEGWARRDHASYTPEEAALWNYYGQAAHETYKDAVEHILTHPMRREFADAGRGATVAPEAAQTHDQASALSAPSSEISAPAAPARDMGTREPGEVVGRVASGFVKALGAVFEGLANMIAPTKPPEPEQQKRDVQVAQEQDEFRRFVAEQSQRLYLTEEQGRDQRRRREQEEERDREAGRSREDDRQR